MITNIIKELEEIKWELSCLGAKITIQRIKNNLEEFEMEMLKTETQNKMEALNKLKKY